MSALEAREGVGILSVLLGLLLTVRYGEPSGAFRSEAPRSPKLARLGRGLIGLGLLLTAIVWVAD